MHPLASLQRYSLDGLRLAERFAHYLLQAVGNHGASHEAVLLTNNLATSRHIFIGQVHIVLHHTFMLGCNELQASLTTYSSECLTSIPITTTRVTL